MVDYFDLIIDKFVFYKNSISDINEHLITLANYSAKCEHITEMGVRTGISTYAFIYGNNLAKIISYDINTNHQVEEIKFLSENAGIDFTFIQENSLNVEIEETDLLFIDTLHIYEQLKAELTLHANKVKKYIILHDTTTFALNGEEIYKDVQPIVENYFGKISGKGLEPALLEFLEENKNWIIKEKFENNNGLTVLERIN